MAKKLKATGATLIWASTTPVSAGEPDRIQGDAKKYNAVAKRPEFSGTVAFAETRGFWRPQEKFGGNKQGNPWHANGESYWLIGEAMGSAMVKLLGNQK